jgi:hypothetical protein
MASVDVQFEHEGDAGWRYDVVVQHDDGTETRHSVSLTWMDHDYWTGGRIAPSRTVGAVLTYCLDHGSPTFPPAFDAARARRWLPAIDQELRQAL